MKMESRGEVITFAEVLFFLSTWFWMATIIGPSQKKWFSFLSVNQFDGLLYKMNRYMTG